MAARRGPEHHYSGPHLPVGPREERPDENLADRAKGERVPRCLACGVAGGLEFELWYRGKAAGLFRICDRCWSAANPPQRADMLDVQNRLTV